MNSDNTAPTEQLRSLLLELAGALESDEPIGTVARPPHPLAARARAAAAEIEAWKMPTDDDIAGLADGQGFTCWAGAIGESVVIDYVGFARALIALLFGGGEYVKPKPSSWSYSITTRPMTYLNPVNTSATLKEDSAPLRAD